MGAEGLEQVGEGDGLRPPARLEDTAKGGESEVQAAQAAAAADEEAVGVHGGCHLVGPGPGDAVEEGDGERGAIARDDGEEAVDGADRGRPGLGEQFVEQVEGVLGADVPRAVPIYDDVLQEGAAGGLGAAEHIPGLPARRERWRGVGNL